MTLESKETKNSTQECKENHQKLRMLRMDDKDVSAVKNVNKGKSLLTSKIRKQKTR